jgi:predicted ATPase/signal transduction histidine kinase/tRNA A-37 threonylcarbamoyl transferase component Bud32
MLDFVGYRTGAAIHQGTKSIVCRAQRLSDGRAVVLKAPAAERPDRRRIAELRHEQAVLARLDIPGVARLVELVEDGRGRVALVLEDAGESSLKQHLDARGPLPLGELLDVAVALAETLGEIHRRGIVHKDVKPHNVVVDAASRRARFVDFSIASVLSREAPLTAGADRLEGTLAYIAPEQTGRMNRGVDHRTDFYSFGVTLYELLSGRLPFTQEVPIELVHAHIALVPRPLHELSPRVPPALSAIVAKLMAKNAEDRYQSAHGVLADLEVCRRGLRRDGVVGEVTPGHADRAEILQLPQRLYGREREIAALDAALSGASGGAAELLLVTGYAGVGKSALVNEVQRGLADGRGFLISGKFDQLDRSTPYEPIAHAFRDLARQLLTEPADVLDAWRHKLLAALGGIGQVLVDLIPEIGLVIGPQPAVPPLPPTEAQNRFTLAFQSFIRVFAADQPLVIFLDDLQWVDPASLRLIQLLVSDPESGRLLVIGAYRDSDVTAAHPLALALDELGRDGARISEIKLAPLTLADVERLIADALGCAPSTSGELARVVFDKTLGNPFFVGQLLRSLADDGVLAFDPGQGAWAWDLARVAAVEATDNVVDFMAAKIQRLAPETRRVIELAACVGHQFSLRELAILRGAGARETARELWEALREGLVVPLSQDYRFVLAEGDDEAPSSPAFSVSYRFLHDRVQQAAYSLIAPERREAEHLFIGRLMLSRAGGEPRDEELFTVADHLNLGARLLVDPAERVAVARLDLRAGRRAKASTAYQAAAEYLRAGMALLEERAWDDDFDLAFALWLERAECEHLSGRFAEAEALFEALVQRARTRRQRLQVQTSRLILWITLGRFPEAIAAGAIGASELGVTIHETDEARRAALMVDLKEIEGLLAGRRAADLLAAPLMTDPEVRDLQKLLVHVNTAAWFVSPALFGHVAAKQVILSLRHGHTDMSALGYCFYGMLLAGPLGRYGAAYAFGSLALALNERFPNAELMAKIHVLFSAFMGFWREPLRAGLEHFKRAYHAGLETGDLVYVSYACDQTLIVRFAVGAELSATGEEIHKFLELMARTKNHVSIEIQTIMRQMIANLEGRTRDPRSLADDGFVEAGYVERLLAEGHRFPASYYYAVKAQLAYLHDEPEPALELTLESEKYVGSGGLFFSTDLVFFACLTLLALLGREPGEARPRYEALLAERRRRLDVWAVEAPMSFLHKKLLVDAEAARVAGDDAAASEAYERALDAAREHDFPHHEALAGELSARFHLAQGRARFARFTMSEAVLGYARWGAVAKVQRLRRLFPQLMPAAGSDRVDVNTSTSTRRRGAASGAATTSGGELDLTSLMKASTAIAGEIVKARLHRLLIQIMVENAGAERGALLLLRDHELVVEAETAVDARAPSGEAVPLARAERVCEPIARYVLRAQEHLVLADACAGGRFQKHPYIQANKVRSVLAAPIKRHGRVTGILYLENNLVPNAFTPDRLHVLELLSAQAAISLENAELYATLDQRVRDRTEELRRSNDDLSRTLDSLRVTQRQLVTQEKLASLGALTAGIAHEIRNPLNFINNFSESSVELAGELIEIVAGPDAAAVGARREELSGMARDLRYNAERISAHGQRAELIVKAMLEHSRGDGGEKRDVDVNALVTEYLSLAREGLRRPGDGVEVVVETSLDPGVPPIRIVPQDIGRVVVNLLNNAWYAAERRAPDGGGAVIRVSTRAADGHVEVRVRDNGAGIPAAVRDKLFHPFFTTKPPGEGTGLGLSISYDIVVQGNGGALHFETEEGAFTEFIVSLPVGATS